MKWMIFLLLLLGCRAKPFAIDKDIGINLSLIGSFQESFQKADGKIIRVVYKSSTDVLSIDYRLEVDPKTGKRLFEEKKQMILSSFQDHPTSYPGLLSKNTSGCPSGHLPPTSNLSSENKRHVAFILQANERLVAVGCQNNMTYYLSSVSILYCENSKRFYEIKYFTPADNPRNEIEKFQQSISCL